METLLIILVLAVLITIGWWLSFPECGVCGEKIYPNQKSYGVSPPSSCDIHAECSIAFHKKLREEPYKSIIEDYKMMLDRQDRHKKKTGRPLDKEEWEGYKKRTREKLKSSILVLAAFLFIGASGAFAGLKSDGGEIGDVSRYERERREYEEIFWIQRDSIDGEWEVAFRRVINRYEKFLEKIGNDSEFADDAKLRIAEFHQILGQKEKSEPYLDDIIKNHPDADAYSIKTGKNSGDKTAAYALYWRAAWFGPRKGKLGDQKDLLIIFEKYRDSEGAVYEVLLLCDDENRMRIIKNFGLNPKLYEIFNLKKAD